MGRPMRLTLTAKLFIAAVVVAVLGVTAYYNPQLWERIAPSERRVGTNIPPTATLPDSNEVAAVPAAPPGCVELPEVRLQHWAWNAQMGLMLATGGKQAAKGSLMCQGKVNLRLIREDMSDN